MVVAADGVLPLPWLRESLAGALVSTHHALLIHGPAGVGQFELALTLAQAWLCEAGAGTAQPCGRCASCRLMQAHSHPDFLLLLPDALREPLGWGGEADSTRDGEGKKAKPSREVKVEAVRHAIGWGQQTSSRGRAKVIVIHPAQTMNAVAANALLKTLEEPPGRLRLLLCSGDPEALLPTVRSRCQRLALPLPAPAVALDWLRGRVEAPEVLLAAAGGRPLEALALAEAGLDATLWQRLPALLQRGEAAPLAGLAVPQVVDALQKLCHDLMARAAGGAPRYFAADTLAPGALLPALAEWAQALSRAARHDEHPWNAGLLLESLVAQGRRVWPMPASAPRRLATLGQR